MQRLDKDRPTKLWIAEMQRRFPCEMEIDRLLVRKLENRAGPSYSPIAINSLVNSLTSLFNERLGSPFHIHKARWLGGGASKLQMAFDLDWSRPGIGRAQTPMVLRMEPAASIVETSRLREFQVIREMEGTIPVPSVYFEDSRGEYLPYPAIIYGFVDGVVRPSDSEVMVTGLKASMRSLTREKLGVQFLDILAKIHSYDWRSADFSAFDMPESGFQALTWQLNNWERVWEEDSHEDVPLIRYAAHWLRDNMPTANELSIVHGDYRTGNYLFTEHDLNISAILDWELAHIGDRHEDIAYTMMANLGGQDEAGNFLVSSLMTPDEFLEGYEKASGYLIDLKRIDYYQVLTTYKLCVAILASNYRVIKGGKTHQDVMLVHLMAISYSMMEELRKQMERVG